MMQNNRRRAAAALAAVACTIQIGAWFAWWQTAWVYDDQALWRKYKSGILHQEVAHANDAYGHSLMTRNRGGAAHVGELMQEVHSLQQDL